jgi:hypothetical protein
MLQCIFIKTDMYISTVRIVLLLLLQYKNIGHQEIKRKIKNKLKAI